MNAIEQMVAAATKPTPRAISIAASLRHALLDGPKTSRELARRLSIRATVVGANLKGDVASGRIRVRIKHDSRGKPVGTYELADQDIQQQLEAARALLIRHGYSVGLPRRRTTT